MDLIVSNLALTTTNFADASLSPVTTYYYLVKGLFGADDGPDSLIASATTEAEPIILENLIISSLDFGHNATTQEEQLTFTIEQSGLGQFYQLYSSKPLETTSWSPLGPVYSGTGGLLEIEALFDYTNPANKKEFFRVGVSIEELSVE